MEYKHSCENNDYNRDPVVIGLLVAIMSFCIINLGLAIYALFKNNHQGRGITIIDKPRQVNPLDDEETTIPAPGPSHAGIVSHRHRDQ